MTKNYNAELERLRDENQQLRRQVEDFAVENVKLKSGIHEQRLTTTLGPLPEGAAAAGVKRLHTSTVIQDAVGSRVYVIEGQLCCSAENEDAARASMPGLPLVVLKRADLEELTRLGVIGGAA